MMWYDLHREGCEAWEVELGEDFDCNCGGIRRIGGKPSWHTFARESSFADELEEYLGMNFSTDRILFEFGGIKWHSLLIKVRRAKLDQLHKRLIALREEENERKRSLR